MSVDLGSDAAGRVWSGRERISGTRALFEAQAGLTVATILTPRIEFVTCETIQTLADAIEGNEIFDYLPVEEARSQDELVLVGMLPTSTIRNHAPDERVGSHTVPLDERWIVGSSMSLLDFIRTADDHPCRLVVDGSQVIGLASLSDLQKLPARAALFGLVTGIEMILTEVIMASFDGGDWKRHMTKPALEKLAYHVGRANAADAFVNELLFTALKDKVRILRQGPWKAAPDLQWRLSATDRMCALRDEVAHSKNYAETPDAALSVCATARDLVNLAFRIEDEMPPPSASSLFAR